MSAKDVIWPLDSESVIKGVGTPRQTRPEGRGREVILVLINERSRSDDGDDESDDGQEENPPQHCRSFSSSPSDLE